MSSKPSRLNPFRRLVSDSLLWRLLRESLPEHKGKYTAAVIAMVMVASTTAMSAWIMGEIVDSMTDTANKNRIYWVALAVLLIFMAKGIASFAQTVC
jgi:ATP-binding cassette, subfamily B, bacterial MsbA